jgi:hypothetical protein
MECYGPTNANTSALLGLSENITKRIEIRGFPLTLVLC